MGFELNRIMQQYGVGTPGRVNYSGATPVDPGTRPVATDTLTGDKLTAAQANYDSLLAKYNIDKANAPTDTAAYDAYKKEYQTRLMNTPMYMQSQFQTGYEPKSAGLQFATRPDVNIATGSGMGLKQFNTNIQDYATKNPNAYSDAINAYADKYGISGQDIFNATQNRWGNVLQAPKYGPAFTPTATVTAPVASIVGGGGNDTVVSTVVGGGGNDLVTLVGGTGNDTLVGGTGNDTVVGATGNDTIVAGTGNDTIVAGTGNDVITDDGTTDVILDTISTMTGGTGNDTLVAADDGTTDGILDTIAGLGGGDSGVYDDGTTGAILDTIAGLDKNKTDTSYLEAAGDDTIFGGGGNDAVVVNNDTLVAADDGTTGGIQDAINELNDKYEVQDWENLDNSGVFDGTMAGDFSLNSDKNTYLGDNAFNLDGSYDFRGSDYDFGGFGGGGKYFDDQSMATMAFAKGGQVKTHYQTAGRVQLPSGYGSPEEEADFLARQERDRAPVEISPVDMSSPPPPMISTRAETEPVNAPLATIAMNEAPVAPAVVAAPKPPPVAPPAFGAERMGNIQALLAAYGPKDGAYGEDLKAARASAKAESDAFAKMLSSAMKSPEDEKSSKAEMYFRLASAFGAPTKTGHFAENLGMVGKELGEYSKGKRASAQQKLALALEGQKMKMTAAKEDLNTLRTLAGKEMDDKRAIATELIKDYIKSGEPQSAAGKQALDEGLKTGTPEYQKRVQEIGNMNIEARLAQITASLAGVNTAAANLALAQEKFKNQQTQQAKLTGPELKLKTETEETLAQTDQALVNLRKAYSLNPNTFDTSLVDVAQRKLLEAGGSKDPKVAATREMENLLEKAALSQLKATFPGAISNDERKALQDVQGLGAKSKEERARIMKNGYAALKTVSERHRKRLNEINSGLYRDTAAPSIDEGTE
jgi:hypothetical protein